MPPLWNKGKLKETSYTRQSGNWLVTNRQTNKDRTDYMLPPFKWKITRKGFSAEPKTLDTMGHRIFFFKCSNLWSLQTPFKFLYSIFLKSVNEGKYSVKMKSVRKKLTEWTKMKDYKTKTMTAPTSSSPLRTSSSLVSMYPSLRSL